MLCAIIAHQKGRCWFALRDVKEQKEWWRRRRQRRSGTISRFQVWESSTSQYEKIKVSENVLYFTGHNHEWMGWGGWGGSLTAYVRGGRFLSCTGGIFLNLPRYEGGMEQSSAKLQRGSCQFIAVAAHTFAWYNRRDTKCHENVKLCL